MAGLREQFARENDAYVRRCKELEESGGYRWVVDFQPSAAPPQAQPPFSRSAAHARGRPPAKLPRAQAPLGESSIVSLAARLEQSGALRGGGDAGASEAERQARSAAGSSAFSVGSSAPSMGRQLSPPAKRRAQAPRDGDPSGETSTEAQGGWWPSDSASAEGAAEGSVSNDNPFRLAASFPSTALASSGSLSSPSASAASAVGGGAPPTRSSPRLRNSDESESILSNRDALQDLVKSLFLSLLESEKLIAAGEFARAELALRNVWVHVRASLPSLESDPVTESPLVLLQFEETLVSRVARALVQCLVATNKDRAFAIDLVGLIIDLDVPIPREFASLLQRHPFLTAGRKIVMVDMNGEAEEFVTPAGALDKGASASRPSPRAAPSTAPLPFAGPQPSSSRHTNGELDSIYDDDSDSDGDRNRSRNGAAGAEEPSKVNSLPAPAARAPGPVVLPRPNPAAGLAARAAPRPATTPKHAVPDDLYADDDEDDVQQGQHGVPSSASPQPLKTNEQARLGHEAFVEQLSNVFTRNQRESARVALETLRTIARHLLESPHDDKFRELRASNTKLRDKLLCVQGAVEVLRSLGFEETRKGDDTFYVCAERAQSAASLAAFGNAIDAALALAASPHWNSGDREWFRDGVLRGLAAGPAAP